MAMLFALATYVYNKTKEENTMKIPDTVTITDPVKITVINIQYLNKNKAAITPPDKPTGGAKNENNGIKVVDSASVKTSTVESNITLPTNTSVATSSLTGLPNTSTLTSGGTGTTTSGGGNEGGVLPWSEEMPEYEGGINAIKNFISKNISYPEKAVILEREGTVRVSFVVNELGNIVDVKVADGIGAGCDEEAVRVVNKLPKFKKPGKNGGKPVKVMFYIPIKFKLQK